eukprot:5969233-Pleurochrysis_carterae.AAC.3
MLERRDPREFGRQIGDIVVAKIKELQLLQRQELLGRWSSRREREGVGSAVGRHLKGGRGEGVSADVEVREAWDRPEGDWEGGEAIVIASEVQAQSASGRDLREFEERFSDVSELRLEISSWIAEIAFDDASSFVSACISKVSLGSRPSLRSVSESSVPLFVNSAARLLLPPTTPVPPAVAALACACASSACGNRERR